MDESANVALKLGDGSVVLTNGRVIPADGEEKPANITQFAREVESGRKAVETLQKMHRKLGDMPDVPQKLNPVAAIITYRAIGLDNEDIATALGATTEQIETICQSDVYKQLEQMFDQTVFEDERRNAKHIIAKASQKAAATMVDMLDSNDENIALVASRDVLKLTGISTEEENTRRTSGLRIVVSRKGEKDDSINVEIS